jgi:hypothetical protein
MKKKKNEAKNKKSQLWPFLGFRPPIFGFSACAKIADVNAVSPPM